MKATETKESISTPGPQLKDVIEQEVGEEVITFISEQVDLTKDKSIYFSSIRATPKANREVDIRTFIDLKTLNHQNNLNAYFRSINEKLPDAGIYIGCVESYTERKERFQMASPEPIVKMIWIADFFVNRVIPKLSLTKNIYSLFSRGKYNVMSKAEILGRLSYSGFEIIDHKSINNLLYFSVIKTSEPKKDKNPSYGLLFKMNRISKAGKIIGVYKVRTMHPYSEYLQDYVVRLNGYNEVGKPNHDFRLTSWGKIIRKLHLDEVPQVLNVLKGDLNIVGVRPISKFGFESLPPDLQRERIKYKPGCIPPNVALKMTGFDGVINAERIYLKEMQENAYSTNFKYFWKAMFNLITRKSSSA
jgi:hypothetical protein